MRAMSFGIGGAEVLAFVQDEEGPAFGILIETPMSETTCPTFGGAVEASDSLSQDLPPITAGPADLLIRWKRRQWRCVHAGCAQEMFGEHNDSVEALGLDEVLMVKRGPWHCQEFSTQLVDVGPGQLLDVVPGRSSTEPMVWLAKEGKP